MCTTSSDHLFPSKWPQMPAVPRAPAVYHWMAQLPCAFVFIFCTLSVDFCASIEKKFWCISTHSPVALGHWLLLVENITGYGKGYHIFLFFSYWPHLDTLNNKAMAWNQPIFIFHIQFQTFSEPSPIFPAFTRSGKQYFHTRPVPAHSHDHKMGVARHYHASSVFLMLYYPVCQQKGP